MSKYHNKKVQIDGMWFDSKKEGNYYLYLKQLQGQGLISQLQTQVPFELLPAVKDIRIKVKHLKSGDKEVESEYVKQRPTYYYADFVYIDTRTGRREVVDVKSAATRKKDAYVLKKKMMLALKGIEILEV